LIIAMRGTIGSLPLIATVASMVSVTSRWAVSVSECDAIQAVKSIRLKMAKTGSNLLILIRHRRDCCVDRQRGRLRWPDDCASAFSKRNADQFGDRFFSDRSIRVKAVYAELHRSHDPQFFQVRGVVKRCQKFSGPI